jgi:polar amino acid transport system substrate-binding protein
MSIDLDLVHRSSPARALTPLSVGARVIIGLATLAILGLTTAAWTGEEKTTPNTSTLRVVTYEWAPFFHHDEQGQVAGLEYDLLRSFAEAQSLQLDVVWKEDFDDVVPTMLNGEADVAAATLTITAERLNRMDFSAPYFPVLLVLVRPIGATESSASDLAGKKIATIAGTTYEQYAEGFADAEIVYVATEEEMFEAVASGKADALATDSPNVLRLGSSYPDLEIVEALSDREFYGLALPRAGPLTGPLTEHIEQLVASGVYWTFLEQAFGSMVADYSDEMKAAFLAD